MKKFFYAALMVLTLGMMASCSGGGGSDYYKNGKTPEINLDNHSVNGVVYDNETEKCWKYTVKTTVLGVTASGDSYLWGTEFELVASCEESMYIVAQAGVSTAKYSYVAVPKFKDSESCLSNNKTTD